MASGHYARLERTTKTDSEGKFEEIALLKLSPDEVFIC